MREIEDPVDGDSRYGKKASKKPADKASRSKTSQVLQDEPSTGLQRLSDDPKFVPYSYMATPSVNLAPPGLTRYRSHNRLSQDRVSQEFNMISNFYQPEKLEDSSAHDVSPLQKHQRSIHHFLDTMKHHPSIRHQQQLELFENLEKELKSIMEVFNNERYQKRSEAQAMKQRIRDLEILLLTQEEQMHKTLKEADQVHASEVQALTSYAKAYKSKLKAAEKELKALKTAEPANPSSEAMAQERAKHEAIVKAKDREIEALRQENEQMRREVQNSYRSNMEQRVLKQSFHFNGSSNAVGMPPCGMINTNGQL